MFTCEQYQKTVNELASRIWELELKEGIREGVEDVKGEWKELPKKERTLAKAQQIAEDKLDSSDIVPFCSPPCFCHHANKELSPDSECVCTLTYNQEELNEKLLQGIKNELAKGL